jgi:hypothetical protein
MKLNQKTTLLLALSLVAGMTVSSAYASRALVNAVASRHDTGARALVNAVASRHDTGARALVNAVASRHDTGSRALVNAVASRHVVAGDSAPKADTGLLDLNRK